MHNVIKISSTGTLPFIFFSCIRYAAANCALGNFVLEISGSKIITSGSKTKAPGHLEQELEHLLSAG